MVFATDVLFAAVADFFAPPHALRPISSAPDNTAASTLDALDDIFIDGLLLSLSIQIRLLLASHHFQLYDI
ncbi:MAG: hypothetical protein ACFNJQ_00260 [Scardovia wiggsiae]